MQFESLKVFCDLAETESFTKTAQIKCVSQSAVSQTISALERHFNSLLIERSKKNFCLTSEGDVLYLAFKTAETISIGNKYTVFRASDIIRDPVTEKKIGRKYSISGNIEIIDQLGNFYAARVLEAFEAVYKGDMIQPYSKEKMEIEPKR